MAGARFFRHDHARIYSISIFGSLFATAVRAPAGVWCVLVVSVVSCGSEHGTSLVGVCAITGVPTGWGWRLLVLLDWARGLDGVFFLTRREHHCASAGTALGLHSAHGECGGPYEVLFASK